MALRSAALPKLSPAWTEARRARKELEQLERITRHLRKGVIPTLYCIEAAHGELIAAVETFSSACGFEAKYSEVEMMFESNDRGGKKLADPSAFLPSTWPLGRWDSNLPLEDHSHMARGCPMPLLD